MTIAVIVAGLMLVARRPVLPWRRRPPRSDEPSVLAFLEMAALAVSSGLSFPQAAAMAAVEVGGEVGTAATRILRGIASADRTLERTFAMAQRAAQSGAPLLPTLDAYIAELRAAESYACLERVRKLPVKLLFPLALLVLPGFLLLTVGPVVAGSLQRLGL